jgi:hypothetical protein
MKPMPRIVCRRTGDRTLVIIKDLRTGERFPLHSSADPMTREERHSDAISRGTRYSVGNHIHCDCISLSGEKFLLFLDWSCRTQVFLYWYRISSLRHDVQQTYR